MREDKRRTARPVPQGWRASVSPAILGDSRFPSGRDLTKVLNELGGVGMYVGKARMK